jgi:hypothetical protein
VQKNKKQNSTFMGHRFRRDCILSPEN